MSGMLMKSMGEEIEMLKSEEDEDEYGELE